MTEFAELLKQLRLAARLTQEALSERAGLSVRSIRDIERGRVRYPRPETVRLIGRALGFADARLDDLVSQARDAYWADRLGSGRG